VDSIEKETSARKLRGECFTDGSRLVISPRLTRTTPEGPIREMMDACPLIRHPPPDTAAISCLETDHHRLTSGM